LRGPAVRRLLFLSQDPGAGTGGNKLKDGASEAEQNQLQPSPKRQGLATYVRVLRPSRVPIPQDGQRLVFWNRLVLCLSSRKFRTFPRSPVSRLRGCIWIWNKGALLGSQEDPFRPAHSAPAPRSPETQPRPDRLSPNAQTTRSNPFAQTH
jgi:hypothetical protein